MARYNQVTYRHNKATTYNPDDEVTVYRASKETGVTEAAIHNAIRNGVLPARRTMTTAGRPRVLLRMDDAYKYAANVSKRHEIKRHEYYNAHKALRMIGGRIVVGYIGGGRWEVRCPLCQRVATGTIRSLSERRCRCQAYNDRRIDLTGKRFGKWTVIRYVGGRPGRWLCVCDCGYETTVQGQSLRNGQSTQCIYCARNHKR